MRATKVLFISHIYALPFNLRKVQMLARYPDLEVEVVTAAEWDDFPLRRLVYCPTPVLDLKVHALPVIFSGRMLRFVYAPLPLLNVAHCFRPDIIHIDEEPGSLALLQAIILKRLLGVRILAFSWENLHGSRSAVVAVMERLTLGGTDSMIAGNCEAAQVLRQKGFRGDVTVMPQFGVNLETFSPARNEELRARLGLRRWTIGFVGRLEERKGLFTLVEATAGLVVDCDLLFIGSGVIKEQLCERATKLGSKANLVFVDTIPTEAVAAYLNCMDVLVLPSLTTLTWKEQFGRVLIEAMACGVPVVGSNSGAIPEVVDDAGLIAREGDAADLRANLERIATDAGLARQLSLRGQARAKEIYSEERVAAATYDIYSRMVRKTEEKVFGSLKDVGR